MVTTAASTVLYPRLDELPNVSVFDYHKTIENIDFDDVELPGLDAHFYRYSTPIGTLSVGVYELEGVETHRAWGWVGEPHCSYHAVANYHGFDGPIIGCPQFTVVKNSHGGAPLGFDLVDSGGLCRRFLLNRS